MVELLKKESYANGKKEGLSISYNRDQSEAGIALYRNDILIAGHGCALGGYGIRGNVSHLSLIINLVLILSTHKI